MAIQETKEAAVAVATLVKFVIAQSKDGFDWSDAAALASKIVGDEQFRKVMVDGFVGIQNIPAEFKTITVQEIIDLGLTILNEVKK